MIHEWMKRRRAKRIERLWKAGYDYAAGRLLRSETTPQGLEWEQAGRYTAFDKGMDSAMTRLCMARVIKDDR